MDNYLECQEHRRAHFECKARYHRSAPERNRYISFLALVVLKLLVTLISRLVDTHTHRHTERLL